MNPTTVASATVPTRILPGGPLRDHLLTQVAATINALKVPVRMCVVQVDDNPASNTYIRHKLIACAKVGIHAERVRLHGEDGEAALHTTIKTLAQNPEVHAIIVQTPLPAGWNVRAALNLVPAAKDIDGLSVASATLRQARNPAALLPATPLGVLRLLEHLNIPLANNSIAVIGKGMVVGAPLQDMLKAAGANLTSIDKETPNPAPLAKACNVVISAAGAPGLVTQDWVKPGAVVIDVGLTRVPQNGKNALVGDVARSSVENIAAVLTPVPGGVGPLTVASLLTNIADAACLQLGQPRPVWNVTGL